MTINDKLPAMPSQLWQLLIKIQLDELDGDLTCMECFAVMELLVAAAELDIDLNHLIQLARDHLDRCPGCREQFKGRLDALAEMAD